MMGNLSRVFSKLRDLAIDDQQQGKGPSNVSQLSHLSLCVFVSPSASTLVRLWMRMNNWERNSGFRQF